jgi:hypothetical protein
MTRPLAAYTFLPWLRQGLANNIATADGDAAVLGRASIDAAITVKAEGVSASVPDSTVPHTVQLIGPGDVIGLDTRAIVKTEPRDRITNFEPNDLSHIEFYDEDFPWRYTPAMADGAAHRLRPWIALVALEESEFTDGPRDRERPLPYVIVPDAFTLFPPAEELWAWSHVHVNRHIAPGENDVVSDAGAEVAQRLRNTLGENADLAYSRLICPRKLEANTGYHMFLVPVFETGRLAGLKLDVGGAPHATHGAWVDYAARGQSDPQHYPYYHRWYFRTGNTGDFEYLARLLQPRPIDPRVGRRDMDTQDPGGNVRGLTRPELHGVLKLGGALKIPDSSISDADRPAFELFEHWAEPYPQPIQQDIADFINLADDYEQEAAASANAGIGDVLNPADGEGPDPDPLVVPPLYGRWHARQKRLLAEHDGSPLSDREGWVHELNLDPRFRVSAGLGTEVVRAAQETYMNAAWAQVGDVLAAQRAARLHLAARVVSSVLWTRDVRATSAVSPDKSLAFTMPVLQRLVPDRTTLKSLLRASPVAPAALSAPMRRAARPGARLERRLAPALPAGQRLNDLAQRLDAGSLVAAPKKELAASVPSDERLADALVGAGGSTWIPPGWLHDPMAPWYPIALALVLGVLAFFVLPIAAAIVASVAVAGTAIVVANEIRRVAASVSALDAVRPVNATPASIDLLPPAPGFQITPPGTSIAKIAGSTDSAEAQRFKTALKEVYTVTEAARLASPPIVRAPVNVSIAAENALALLDPSRTIAQRFHKLVRLPGWIREGMVETFDEPMAYPRIDLPMYEPLADLGSDYFLPNVGLIEQNTISLLETNQKFIESYLVGVNHEFARELLWREFPTDQRGTYFRQFWDVGAYKVAAGTDPDALREELYDIPKLHTWSGASKLGEHDNREIGGAVEEEVVLVIRGELLKRYPTAVIYAHRAQWQLNADGSIDRSKPRLPIEVADTEALDPPRDKIKTPLYGAKVMPDISFFGFDLTVPAAKGGTGEHAGDDPGWFFVIKERPGEPRFGLDVERPAGMPLVTWNDLAWNDVLVSDGTLKLEAAMPARVLEAPGIDEPQPEKDQHAEDVSVPWNASTNAADVAYVLFQVPVLVAVHAAEMLPHT